MDKKKMERVKLKRFVNMGQYFTWNFDRDVKYHDMGKGLHLAAPALRRVLEHDSTGVNPDVNPDKPLGPVKSNDVARWRQQAEKIKKSGKYFSFWGICDFHKLPTGPGFGYNQCQMPPDEYKWMMSEIGDQFLGWEIGELDGLFGRDVIYYLKPEERPKTRREGHRMFMKYLKEFHRKLYKNTNGLCGVTFPHYFHELPTRMLGAELGQGLLNTQVYVSFLRGACRQYDLQYLAGVSVFDRWGLRSYVSGTDVIMFKGEGEEVAVHKAGPNLGHSVGFFQAAWVINYYAGASIVATEGGYYTDELKAGVRQLSPLGKAFQDFGLWAEKNPPRGKQMRPLALMLDYYAGWTPPRHLYSFQDRVVWHSIPYGPSDHGMDQAYDLFYPGYGKSGFYRDERGFITPTPCGDAVDVLLSDASLEVMSDSPLIWYLSDETPDADLLNRWQKYVKSGGHLVISGNPMVTLAEKWFKMKITGTTTQGIHSVIKQTGEEVRENFFPVRRLPLDRNWTLYAQTESGLPLIAFRKVGKGKVTFLGADHGLTEELIALGFDMNRYLDVKMDPPFEILNSVKRYVQEATAEHLPVEIKGENIYYAVNRLPDGSLIVCLYNPGTEVWNGGLSLKGNKAQLKEIKGPWRNTSALKKSVITLRGNETAVFRAEEK